MNEQLFLRYQDNFDKIINERYRFGDKMYNFDDYDIDKLKDTMKVASKLFLDLHRAMTVFDALSDEIELD